MLKFGQVLYKGSVWPRRHGVLLAAFLRCCGHCLMGELAQTSGSANNFNGEHVSWVITWPAGNIKARGLEPTYLERQHGACLQCVSGAWDWAWSLDALQTQLFTHEAALGSSSVPTLPNTEDLGIGIGQPPRRALSCGARQQTWVGRVCSVPGSLRPTTGQAHGLLANPKDKEPGFLGPVLCSGSGLELFFSLSVL